MFNHSAKSLPVAVLFNLISAVISCHIFTCANENHFGVVSFCFSFVVMCKMRAEFENFAAVLGATLRETLSEMRLEELKRLDQ